MKRKLLQVIRSLRSRGGNTVAEFAVTAAMMATLAATAAPKISDASANSMISIKESADLYNEVQQLNHQRELLKDEIFELLVAQNQILMKNVANSHLRDSAADYSFDLSNNEDRDLYDDPEPNDDYRDDVSIRQQQYSQDR
ncbi:uncharacterized protein METZ01_LOCUS154672 [marine metagenome]|uniref:Uncharacterized protein n=1 Tax=marine metagenome TaxID=408172 RepID=A0A382AK28_9ZZZZ